MAENGWTSGPRLMKRTPSGAPSRSNGVPATVRTVDMPPLARGAANGYSASAAQMSVTWIVRRSRRIRALTVPATGTDSPIAYDKRSGPCRATRRRCSPSRWKMAEPIAPHTRAAFSTTASMTGWRSVGELAITRRISAVAVCCSSASSVRLSLNSRTFSMAMTACSANVLSQLDLLGREELDFSPPQGNRPRWARFAKQRRGQHRPSRDLNEPRACLRLGKFRGQRLNVLDVDRLAIKDHAPGSRIGGSPRRSRRSGLS